MILTRYHIQLLYWVYVLNDFYKSTNTLSEW